MSTVNPRISAWALISNFGFFPFRVVFELITVIFRGHLCLSSVFPWNFKSYGVEEQRWSAYMGFNCIKFNSPKGDATNTWLLASLHDRGSPLLKALSFSSRGLLRHLYFTIITLSISFIVAN